MVEREREDGDDEERERQSCTVDDGGEVSEGSVVGVDKI